MRTIALILALGAPACVVNADELISNLPGNDAAFVVAWFSAMAMACLLRYRFGSRRG